MELQPLIEQRHERGRYHLLYYRAELDSPLLAEDAVLVGKILQGHVVRRDGRE
ncbi:MAG: hypothetical protein GX456_00870 [Verrucomicrobia bacterium]|nr:hypothetical protein [Verrucomicrobiota bacterium]